MKIQLDDNREVDVRFRYTTEQRMRNRGEYTPIVTKCVVTMPTLDGTTASFEGEALCAPEDQFEYAKGRRIALAEALRLLPRAARKALWERLFKVMDLGYQGEGDRRF